MRCHRAGLWLPFPEEKQRQAGFAETKLDKLEALLAHSAPAGKLAWKLLTLLLSIPIGSRHSSIECMLTDTVFCGDSAVLSKNREA